MTIEEYGKMFLSLPLWEQKDMNAKHERRLIREDRQRAEYWRQSTRLATTRYIQR